MTVSPTWPQDGNRQPNASVSDVESDENSRGPALPPTLFTLPSLSTVTHEQSTPDSQAAQGPAPQSLVKDSIESSSSPKSSQVSSDRYPDDRDSGDPPRTPQPPAVATGLSAPATTSVTPPQDNPRFSTAAAPQNTSLDRSPVSSASSVGRSWMESIGSHGIVVVLLLVVVAAALLTGRDPDEFESSSSLAEHSELLNFDEGTQMDLPLPTHHAPATTRIAASSEPDLAIPDLEIAPAVTDSANQVMASDLDQTQQVITEPQTELAAPHLGLNVDPPADLTANSTVALDPPQLGQHVTTETPNFSLASETAESSRVQINEFMGSPTNVDVLSAGNRTVPENPGSRLPSLEDLADQPTFTSEQNTLSQAGPQRRFSTTPLGVADWSQYLPELPPAVAADAPTSN